MHINIYTCKCLLATNQKSKLQYHQSPSEGKKIKKYYSKLSVNLCTVCSLSRQLFKRWTRVTVLRMEYEKTLHCQRRLSQHKQEDPLQIRYRLQMSSFWCRQEEGLLFLYVFSTEEAMINKRLLHFYLLSISKRGQLKRRVMP